MADSILSMANPSDDERTDEREPTELERTRVLPSGDRVHKHQLVCSAADEAYVVCYFTDDSVVLSKILGVDRNDGLLFGPTSTPSLDVFDEEYELATVEDGTVPQFAY